MNNDILPKLEGKTLIIKDGSTLINMPPETFKDLRACYDKEESNRRKEMANKILPVTFEGNGQVGQITLTKETVAQLEKLIEAKFEDFNCEPFFLSFAFSVDAEKAKITIKEMNILIRIDQ